MNNRFVINLHLKDEVGKQVLTHIIYEFNVTT